MYTIRKKHLGFMLLEPIAAVWPPIYEMWLLLSPILSVESSRRGQIAAGVLAVPELVTGTKQSARDKSQQEPPAKRNASCCGVVSHGLQATSTGSYWSTGWWERKKTDQQPKESFWSETGRSTLQFFKSRSLPIIAGGLQQRGICRCTTTFTFCIFHKLFGVSKN